MTEHFDDMMRSRLNNHESQVPQDMFDNIRHRIDAMDQSFDAAVSTQVINYASAVPANMFDDVNGRMEFLDQAFDADINSRLNNYQSIVPADMWQRIMTNKDKRRPVAWWWAAALLFLVLSGGLLYYFNENNRNLPTNGINKTGVNEADMTVKDKETSNKNPLTINDDITVNHLPSNNSNPAGQIFSNKELNSTPSVIPPNQENFFSTNNKTKKGGPPATRGIFKGNGEEDNETSANRYNSSLPNETAIMNDANNQFLFRQLIRSSLEKLSPRQLLQANLKTPAIQCPINGDEPRNEWYVELYASPMMVFKNVADKVAGKNIRTGMDSTLHKQLSFNAGINLVKNIGEHFLLKAGVQYNQVNEVFRNTRVNEIKLITTIRIRTVILALGDTIYIRDTSVIQQTGTVTRQKQNHYKSWDIPIIIGYEFGGKDLRLNANVGVIANIRSSYKGDMLDTIQQTINIADYKKTGVYKTNIGLGIYAGLGIVKSLSEKTDLWIEPHARINLANMTTDAAWFKQKNIVAGLSVGVRYKLNGRRQR